MVNVSMVNAGRYIVTGSRMVITLRYSQDNLLWYLESNGTLIGAADTLAEGRETAIRWAA